MLKLAGAQQTSPGQSAGPLHASTLQVGWAIVQSLSESQKSPEPVGLKQQISPPLHCWGAPPGLPPQSTRGGGRPLVDDDEDDEEVVVAADVEVVVAPEVDDEVAVPAPPPTLPLLV